MSGRHRVTCDLFTLPYKDDLQILYAPRLGFICSANAALVDLLANLDRLDTSALTASQRSVLDYLDERGVLNGSPEVDPVRTLPERFTPTMATLFPTNQCNLRCRYCYAAAGEADPMVMDFRLAVAAVDRVIENVAHQKGRAASIAFHGGGEPLLPWAFIRKTVEYAEGAAEKAGLRLSVFSATNGLLSERQLEWITAHFQSLNISFDGLPEIQDLHRPLPNGRGSFEFVDRTLRFLDERGFNYGLRATISAHNVDRMEESLDFIVGHYRTRQIHFEPLFFCGRCKTSGDLNPDLDRFADNFRRCEARCAEEGVRLTYSGCRLETLTSAFCGVSSDNFSVTPDGHVTACYEVTTKDDPKSDTFFIGRIDPNGGLEIDDAKRRFLHSLRVENLAFCQDCFAKWHCAGDCAVKLGHTDYTGPRGHDRCQLNRELTADRIHRLLEGNSRHPEPNPNAEKESHTGGSHGG
jgi:uncharacterized protein